MPRQRKSEPLSIDHAALGRAIEARIDEIECMSQDTVAREAGLSQRRVNEYVRGRGNPSFTSLLGVCKGLHLTFEEFVTRVEREKKRLLR